MGEARKWFGKARGLLEEIISEAAASSFSEIEKKHRSYTASKEAAGEDL